MPRHLFDHSYSSWNGCHKTDKLINIKISGLCSSSGCRGGSGDVCEEAACNIFIARIWRLFIQTTRGYIRQNTLGSITHRKLAVEVTMMFLHPLSFTNTLADHYP